MLAPLPPLTAYRLDCARADGTSSAPIEVGTAMSLVEPEEEARWLRTAVTLDAAARARGAKREVLLRQFLDDEGVHPMGGAGLPHEYISGAAQKRAREMEDWTYLRLAYSTLAATSAILPDALLLERGRAIAQRARVARQLGASDAATLYYEEVAALSIAGDLPELAARAMFGHGVLAQITGNHPRARALYQKVLSLDGAAAESRSSAHQGLMILAAQKRDFDSAMEHAWEAYTGASDSSQKDAMLVDLAQVLLDVGQPCASLRGFAAALARHPHPRSALPAFGGAALAAVAAREASSARAIVRMAASRVEMMVASLGGGMNPNLAYQSASALVELSEALSAVGEMLWSGRCAAHASQIAAYHRFHQLSFRLEQPSAPPIINLAATPVQLEIAERVEALEGAELVGIGI